MKNIQEVIHKLNELNITQTKGDWTENIPEDIWNTWFKDNFKELSSGLEVDTHRWYETSISVIAINNVFLGIKFITNMFSESQGYDDCCVQMRFYYMKEVKVITYTKC